MFGGQYTAGTSDGKPVPGYLEEEGANRGSETETFIALKIEIDNWRWSGVPFYIRTGKRLPEKMSQIIIHFKPAPHYIFDQDQRYMANNKLIIRLQPDVMFCPTGGIWHDTAKDYLMLDNVKAVGGSWLTPADLILSEDWAGITALARASLAGL